MRNNAPHRKGFISRITDIPTIHSEEVRVTMAWDRYTIGVAERMENDRLVRCLIIQDPDPESPREWDNLGTMVCFSKSYNLGDPPGRKHNFENPYQFLEFLRKNEDKVLVLPLYLMDHGSLAISVDDTMFRMVDSVGWDWGQVGWIYVTYEDIRKAYGVRRVTSKVLEKARQALTAEVELYNKYLQGYAMGFIIEEHHPTKCWQTIGSCFGFYEFEDLLYYVPEEYKELAQEAWDNRGWE
jgi:hypothetical protein